MAYDAARARIVLYGGSGTLDGGVWEWDGTSWTEQLPESSPPLLSGHAMAYDAARHRVVLFGGATRDGALQDRTWEWDGMTWHEVLPATRPPARAGHAMAYDSERGKVVLFGGAGDGGILAPRDVWEFDGATWTEHATVSAPAATSHAAMVYNVARGKVMLFGGDDASDDPQPAIWEWDGIQWTPSATLGALDSRSSPALAYDILRDRLVVFGGRRQPAAGRGDLGDTWEWDGYGWTDRGVVPASPGALQNAGLIYDRSSGVAVLFGGELFDDTALHAGIGLRSQTWQWDEFVGWRLGSDSSPPVPGPSPRAGFAMANGEDRTLMFGGIAPGGRLLNETWELLIYWDEMGFFDPPGTTPPARAFAAMAHDDSRDMFVLFGGMGSAGALSDTWERDGFQISGWTAKASAHRPPARQGHAMAYDAVRKRVVLFGGAAAGVLGDTWEWDGIDWTQRTPATSPTPRTGAAMAYDVARGRLVLFGGSDGSHIVDDTWEWDGATWQLRTSAQDVPPAPRAHAMAFDAQRNMVVMVGGVHDDTAGSPARLLDDVWGWDGASWRNLVMSKRIPPPRSSHAMAYREYDKITLMSGGIDREHARVLNDTWAWDGAQWIRYGVFTPPRFGHAISDHGFGDHLVLFGGQDNLTLLNLRDDTWTYVTGWDDHHLFLRPPPRTDHVMVHEVTTNSTMIFGGTGYAGLLSDQWSWSDDYGWVVVTPDTVPPKRAGSALAYDASRKRVVLFGGQGESSLLGDVWEWDGKTWTDHSSETAFTPTPRTGHTLVYDDKRQRVVLFGGRSDVAALNDMWEWNGTTWTALPISPASPAPRRHHTMSYDAERDALVLFGGEDAAGHSLQDTWVFRYDSSSDPPPKTCATCDFECGACHRCGDYRCDPGETCSSCPGDCGACP
jgi:hypothetical protein